MVAFVNLSKCIVVPKIVENEYGNMKFGSNICYKVSE